MKHTRKNLTKRDHIIIHSCDTVKIMFIFCDMNRPQLRVQYPKPTYRIASIKFMPRYNIQIIKILFYNIIYIS